MKTDGLQPKVEKVPEHILRTRLERLLRVKNELWEDCLPIPPELEEKIRETAAALGLE